MQVLAGKVDAELVDRIALGEVLEAWKVEKANEGVEIVAAKLLVEALIDPSEEERVERLGEIVTVIGRSVGIEKNGANLVADQLCLVCERLLERLGGNAKVFSDGVKYLRVADGSESWVRCLS